MANSNEKKVVAEDVKVAKVFDPAKTSVVNQLTQAITSLKRAGCMDPSLVNLLKPIMDEIAPIRDAEKKVGGNTKNALEKATALVSKLTDEEKAKLLEELK